MYDLSTALYAEIQKLSTALSGEIDSLSAALSGEINSVSAEFAGLIGSTSAEITGIVSAVSSDLSGAVDAKFASILDLSGLSGDFTGLSGLVGRTLDDIRPDAPGLVKLQDEHSYDGEPTLRNYDMRMISGTIWLHRT